MTVRLPGRPPADHPARLHVGVVGTGRVGSVLAAALQRAGHRVVAAFARSAASRSRAKALLPEVPLVALHDVLERSDLVLLTVPDDALPGLVADLAMTGAFRPGQLVVHTSGRHGVGVLSPATGKGALPLALHPAMTFAGTRGDLDRLSSFRFGVTAPEQLWPVAEVLVVEMGAEPIRIAEEHRVLYHAALAHGANHLITLVADAADLLRQARVTQPEKLLEPLLTAALDNALRLGDAALTGPVSRGDAETVAAHLNELVTAAPDAVASYLALARRTADRALSNGRLTAAAAEPLLDILANRDSGAPA